MIREEYLMKEFELTKNELIAEQEREFGLKLNSKMKKAIESFVRNELKKIPELELRNKTITKLKEVLRNVLLKTDAGILCLTEINNNGPMWENYASDYQKFVVVFNTDNIFFDRRLSDSDPFRHLVPVKYPLEREEKYIFDYASLPNDALFQYVIYTKDNCYQYEREWRMFIANTSLLRENGCVELQLVPIEAINSIYLGPKSDNDLFNIASAFTIDNRIPLFRMVIGAKLKLEPELISPPN